MTQLTAAEVRQRYIDAMGAELGEVFYRLVNQCAWLHLKWHEYVVLFGTSESRIDLLNNAAPGYVRMLQDVLLDDVLLHICRMTDPPVVGRKKRETLTVHRLAKQVDDKLRPRLQELLDITQVTNTFARDWRNRHISHHDLALALEAATPLLPATRQGVRDAIDAIAAVLNCIECHYGGLPVAYEHTVPDLGDAEALVSVIEMGVKARDDRFTVD